MHGHHPRRVPAKAASVMVILLYSVAAIDLHSAETPPLDISYSTHQPSLGAECPRMSYSMLPVEMAQVCFSTGLNIIKLFSI